mmetsp:Transcript_33248/g.59885  ORF Transcript_33248/g.59885 Transcript_33248/m.59885 type:complete len:85 (+) Transcript_33248:88-342(+)
MTFTNKKRRRKKSMDRWNQLLLMGNFNSKCLRRSAFQRAGSILVQLLLCNKGSIFLLLWEEGVDEGKSFQLGCSGSSKRKQFYI